MTKKDMVNHPEHYETNGIECFDAIVASQGVDAAKDFCICNAFKYVWRHSHKNGLEDIKKAIWYLNKYVEICEKPKNINLFWHGLSRDTLIESCYILEKATDLCFEYSIPDEDKRTIVYMTSGAMRTLTVVLTEDDVSSANAFLNRIQELAEQIREDK